MNPDFQTEIHDEEIFLLYRGVQAGVLFPSPDFPVSKIREVVAILNEVNSTGCRSKAEFDALEREILSLTRQLNEAVK